MWGSDSFDEEDRYWDALEELLGSIDPIEFKHRYRDITKALVSIVLPEKFERLFHEITLCYQLGLFNAVVVFCRSTLEVVIEEYLMKKSIEIRKREKEGHLESLINRCNEKQFILESSKDKAHRIRSLGNDILHEGSTCTHQDALSVIRDTITIIEDLYKE